MNKTRLEFLKEKASDIRKITIEMIGRFGVGHVGGALSCIDALTAIYYDQGNFDPKNPKDPDRDRVVLSKGHAGPALYSILAEKGYFPMEEIATLNRGGTNLPSHCDMNKTIGVDFTAGSLGQGLSAAIGMALAARMDNKDYHTYCIIGDGEAQEGQIWEALLFAGNHKLNNLTIMLDNNKMQIDDYVDNINSLKPIDKKMEAFNFNYIEIDGNDMEQVLDALIKAKECKDKCTLIGMNTVKGFGVEWAANKGVGSHSFSISEAEWKAFCNKETK